MEGVFVQQILVAETSIFFLLFFFKKCGQQPGGTGFQPIKETKEIVENHTLGPAQ